MRRLLAAGAVTVLAVVTPGCTSVEEVEPIKVGLVYAQTGTHRGPGSDIHDGFQLYLETHDGKLGGRPVTLVTGDEGEGAETAAPTAQRMINEGVHVLTGAVTTGAAGGIAPLATEHRIPFVGANGRPRIEDGEWVWHTSFLTEDFGASLGKYMAESIDGPVYAMGTDFSGAHEGLRGFVNAFTAAGGELANPDGQPTLTPPGSPDYTPFLEEVRNSGARAVYGFYVAAEAVEFIKQYQRADLAGIPLYGSGLTEGGDALRVLGETALGVFTTFNYAADLDNEANRAFVAAWDAKHPGRIPSGLVVGAYDAGAVLDRAIAAAGPDAGPQEINEAIGRLGKIDSPRGEWEFGPKSHTPVQRWYLREVRRDGRTLSNSVLRDLVTLGG